MILATCGWLAIAITIALLAFGVDQQQYRSPRSPSTLVLVTALIIGLSLAQAIRNSRVTYPFDAWTMYTSRVEHRSFVKYIGRDQTGRVFDLPFHTVLPSEPRALAAKVDQLLRKCNCRCGDARVDDLLRATTTVIARRTNKVIQEITAYSYLLPTPYDPPKPATTLYVWPASSSGVPCFPAGNH